MSTFISSERNVTNKLLLSPINLLMNKSLLILTVDKGVEKVYLIFVGESTN